MHPGPLDEPDTYGPGSCHCLADSSQSTRLNQAPDVDPETIHAAARSAAHAISEASRSVSHPLGYSVGHKLGRLRGSGDLGRHEGVDSTTLGQPF